MQSFSKDQGSTMDGYGNTCFFNSLRAELESAGHPGAGLGYSDFLSLGGFELSFRGRMVDTYTHFSNLLDLANNLDVNIIVYNEDQKGIYEIGTVFRSSLKAPNVHIVKVHNRLHFEQFFPVGFDASVIEEAIKLASDIRRDEVQERDAAIIRANEEAAKLLAAQFGCLGLDQERDYFARLETSKSQTIRA